MAQKTPPLNARGVYQLQAPWSAPSQVIYTCKAIRSFEDIYDLGHDVYEEYYQPMGIDQATFAADAQNNPNIITLIADTTNASELFGGAAIIYVPDTYILAYPQMGDVAYMHMALGIDLGPLPDYLDLSFLKTQVANVVSDVIGVVAPALVVKEFRIPSTGHVSAAARDVLEAARLGAITLRTTDHARIAQLEADKTALQAQITTLLSILGTSGLWPPVPLGSDSIVQKALLARLSDATPSANYTLGVPTVDTGTYNTKIDVTGVTPNGLENTVTLHYNRLDITILLGSASVNITTAEFTAAGSDAMAAINTKYNLALTTADYTVTNPSAGVYLFTTQASSQGWNGANLTVNVV